MKPLLFGLLLLLSSPLLQANPSLSRLSQLIDYIAVDYPGAVADGVIVNPVEYREMQDFARQVRQLADRLPDNPRKPAILHTAEALQARIDQSSAPAEIRTLSARLRRWLIDAYDLPAIPARAPDLAQARRLYAEQCAGCHGREGRGDGPLGRGMQPPPVDFTDPQRYRNRTLYGLYGVISHGVEGTEMRGFSDLTEEQRWSLAFLVGGMALTPEQLEQARQSLLDGDTELAGLDLATLATATPAEIESQRGADAALAFGWLRRHPQPLFSSGRGDPLTLARNRLRQALERYRSGDAKAAQELAVSAYLDGFEQVEGNLDAIDHALRLRIEDAMTGLRQSIRRGVPAEEFEAGIESGIRLLAEAGDRLRSTRLAAPTAFVSALLILLREGLEAILVIAALAAFLIKTGRRDGLRWLGLGVLAALALGGLTWWASSFIDIGGAGRELTEGLAALFAAGMLFFVGFWLHGKTGAAQWKAFIQGNIQKALGQGALWGLSSLAFIAVYREIFESVLFYKALWLQTDASGQSAVIAGFLAACAALLALAWLILRYSTRLPLRQFFSVTAGFMFVLAVVFAGKGVAALQETGKLPINRIEFPRIDLLGIYPTLQGLGLQLTMILLALWLLRRNGGGRDRRHSD